MRAHSCQRGLYAAWVIASLTLLACRREPAAPPLPSGPELYGAGLFSTGAWDFFLAFSPDARTVLFCRANPTFSEYAIYETRRGADGRWSAPVRPSFASGPWSDADPHVSPDGSTVYFISNRPADTSRVARRDYDVWRVRRLPNGRWGEPEHLPAPVNADGVTEWSPTVTASGDLYVGTARRGGKGGNDIWRSRLVDGVYQPLENLGDSVNTPAGEIEPWIAPDERYLLFSGAARADSVGGYDLYISYRVRGVWQKARRLENGVNTPALEFNQSVSPDGAWLYFSSTRPHAGAVGERFDWPRDGASVAGIGNGLGDVYRVPMTRLGVPRP